MRLTNSGKVMLLLAIIFAFAFTLSATDRQINLSSDENQIQLRDNSDLGFSVQFKVGELKISEVQTKAGLYDELSIDGWGFTSAVGEPKLPIMRKIIAVPVGADVRYTINSQQERQLPSVDNQLKHRIIPAQESISKSADPSTIPFIVKEEAYAQKGFGKGDFIRIEEIGYMRGVRLFAIEYYPVRYNPVDNSISVMQDLTLRIDFDHPDLVATADLLARTGSYEFDKLYNNTIFNWQQDERATLLRYPTKMLILCPPNYVTTLQPFVDWKKQQGFTVVVTTVGTGGTVANTTAAINTYMASVWAAATTPDPAPSFLIIVGDTSTSGDNIIANTGTAGTHVTDLTYVRLNGTDMLPEMYYGRFSVSSATELTNIINKTVTFEKTAMPDLSYLGNVVMIAGADASYAPTYGNGQINYGTTYYFNATNGLTSNTYLYPASESSSAAIIANANTGRGYMNYTAHGSETGWYSPAFSVSDVNAMTNTNKYGVMVGNCCVTSKFDYTGGPCFGEALIRKANAAAVAYIGCTNNSYWDEDYWWGIGYKTPIQAAAHPYSATTLGAYDAMFHTHGEASSNWAPSVGETNYMGLLAVEQSTSPRKPYYWEIYSIMGDPSVMTYFGVPTTNIATYPSQILIGATSINVTAQPYSRVALTMGGTLYGTGIVPSGGSLTLTITPFSSVGTAKLVITAQNKITVQADVSIIPNSGPYVSVSASTYADANNNAAEYNENGFFNVTYQNVGSVVATNVVATLTCSTTGITLTDNTETIASLAAGASTSVTHAYALNIANNVANGTSAAFTITMVSGTNTWTYNFTQTINAPVLAFGTMTITDPSPGNANGRLDPGETVTITMPLNNTGAAASPAGSSTLTCGTSGITVNTGTASFSAIAAAGSANLTFSVTAASSMTIGTVASLVFNATAGAYTATKTESVPVGLITETFETGNFASFPWIQGTTPWVIVNTGAYAGTYAAKSGTILASGSTTMETTRILTASGTLTFWYKVSSESGYDYLKFYIDGTVQNSWAGEVAWTQASYTLAVGTHILKWEYMKDGSVDSGSDCAWVDSIVFPASTAPSSFYPPQNFAAAPGNGFVNLSWAAPLTGTPTGYKIFKNSSLLTTVTGLSYSDTAVVNETNYSYYLKAAYSGGDSDPTNTLTVMPTATVPTTVIIGTGTSSNTNTTACPINVYYQSLHGQSVYTKAELNALGVYGPINITQLGFNITALPTLTMPNFIVRMVHTTSADVTSWIPSTGMTTVFTAASYLPTATGWNMLTLSTPFTWNGTSNIVIDTAYGLIGSYTSSGTTQYTTVTNGYRYVRLDTADQTSVFTGGSTSTQRPNLKLTLVASSTGPLMTVTPTTLTFGNVAIGGNSVQQFTIQNTGDQTLTGSITTPTGFSVAEVTRSEGISASALNDKTNRNTLSFTVNTGTTKTYNVTFAPTSAISYSGNVAITSNAVTNPNVNVAVSGSGSGAMITLTPATLAYGSLNVNATSTQQFTVQNTGNSTLTGTIATPTGYTVAALTRESGSGLEALQINNADRNSLAISVNVGSTNTYNLTFAPTANTSYNGNVVVTTNALNTPTANIAVTGSGISAVVSVNPTSIPYGNVVVNATSIQQFTVQNTGNIALSGTIATPAGYSVAVVTRESEDGFTDIQTSSDRNSLSIFVSAGQTKTYNLTFAPTAAAAYNGNVVVTTNAINSPSVNIAVTGNGYIPPTISIDYNTLDATLAFNGTGDDTFTISNTGSQNLTYTLTESPAVDWFNTAPGSGTVTGGGNQLITGTFSSAGLTHGVYTTTLQIISNDTAHSLLNVAVTLNVTNTLPTIDIPANCAFDENATTTMDFTPYVNDVDGQSLTLGYSGNTNIQVQITGLSVQFSAPVDWIGEELITFSVFDGIDYAYDTMTVKVNIVYLPEPPVTTVIETEDGVAMGWTPVPNAQYYKIYRAFEPYGTYEYIGMTTSTNFEDWGVNPQAFYKIVAVYDDAKK